MSVSFQAIPNDDLGEMSATFTNLNLDADFNYVKRDGVFLTKTLPPSNLFVPDSVYADYQVRSGQPIIYNTGEIISGQETAPFVATPATLNLDSAWIHHVGRGATTNLGSLGALQLFNLEGQKDTVSRESNILRLAALDKPVIRTASQTQRIIECPVIIPQRDRATVMPVLEEILWSNELFCFRDPAGELIFCTIPSQETKTNLNVTMTLTLWESDYTEGVLS